MNKIAILTRDCAGVNACIRSVVRTCSHKNIEVIGVKKGYDGLIDEDFIKLNRRDVSGIINQGGTILKTSRSSRFRTIEGQEKAVENLKRNNIDGLIVVGGNGSLTGAHVLASEYNFPVIGVPATIDNDISGVKLTLGADTAVNVALEALDKIRDTATSLERIFIVEVMGRDSGYIAMQVALAGGCEEVLVPERKIDYKLMCEEIKEGNRKGKVSWIIIVAEGAAEASNISEYIKSNTGFETRVAVLGHIQRGGRPTATDRIKGACFGNYAVEMLIDNQSDKCVCFVDDKLDLISLENAIKPKEIEMEKYYNLIKILT